MERRSFFKILGGTATLVAANPLIVGTLYAADGSNSMYRTYGKVQLVDESGKAILASSLTKETPYIFNYPHASTPCMLVDLPEPTSNDIELVSANGDKYIWKGGVGKDRTIVAYVAICTHQLTHPTKNNSFITYVAKDKKTVAYDRSGIIVCSAHMSAYDPAVGCKVLGGAATQPLNAVVIEVASDDTIWASGILGMDIFHEYFTDFKDELKEFYKKPALAQKLVSVSAKTVPLSKYTKEIIQY
jgi:Rieske Fe-S protein